MYPIDHQNHDFRFTSRWFLSGNRITFIDRVLPHWAGKPILYLEIGVFEGQSLCWMLQHVLTHPDARAVAVDPWVACHRLDQKRIGQALLNACHNVKPWSGVRCPDGRLKCRLVRRDSSKALRIMMAGLGYGVKLGTVDLCLIDGDHSKSGAYNDACNVLELLKPGGWMIFDDVVGRVKKQGLVADGVKQFLDEHGSRVGMLWRGRYMACYRKIK